MRNSPATHASTTSAAAASDGGAMRVAQPVAGAGGGTARLQVTTTLRKKLPSWQVPKAEYSPETYAVVSSVTPSAILPNTAVSTWSKSKSPRFSRTGENTCTTQYDLNRADKYLNITRGSVMLGAPRSKLARKLDSHALGNVPDFLRHARSYNVRGGVMASRTSREKEFLPAIVRPRRSPAEVAAFIRRKRAKRLASGNAGGGGAGGDGDDGDADGSDDGGRGGGRGGSRGGGRGGGRGGNLHKKRTSSWAAAAAVVRRPDFKHIKARYLGHSLPLKLRQKTEVDRQKYAEQLRKGAAEYKNDRGLEMFVSEGAYQRSLLDLEGRPLSRKVDLRTYENLAPASAGLRKLGIFVGR